MMNEEEVTFYPTLAGLLKLSLGADIADDLLNITAKLPLPLQQTLHVDLYKRLTERLQQQASSGKPYNPAKVAADFVHSYLKYGPWGQMAWELGVELSPPEMPVGHHHYHYIGNSPSDYNTSLFTSELFKKLYNLRQAELPLIEPNIDKPLGPITFSYDASQEAAEKTQAEAAATVETAAEPAEESLALDSATKPKESPNKP